MAQSQSTLIAQGSTDRLLDLLSQRQIIIDQFTATQTQLGEMTQTLDRHMDRASNPQQEQIKRLMGDIGEQLTQIMRCDERDQAALCTSRDQIKQELSTMGTARQARSAYRPAVQDTRFADRRG